MFMNYYLYLLMLIFSLLLVCYFYNQVLMVLISLEFLMLSMLMLLSFILNIFNMLYLLMFYLLLVVCESVMGLTLLIFLLRSKGNDNLNLLNLVLW